MTKRLLPALLVLLVALPMQADFNSLARAIDSHRGVKRVWIPFLGVARFAVRMVQPEGVQDFQLAVFKATDRLDPRSLQELMKEKIGEGFKPLVQVWSRKSGNHEWSFIYARPSGGDRIELVVLAHDDEETALIRVEVDASVVARNLNDPRSVSRVARHDH